MPYMRHFCTDLFEQPWVFFLFLLVDNLPTYVGTPPRTPRISRLKPQVLKPTF